MTGLARRVRAERDLWSAVWQQVETFLDRIDSAAEQDAPHVRAMAALLPVIGVIERARRRADGYGLAAALPISPRGAGLPAMTAAVLDATRVPGAEECELAVAAYAVPAGVAELGGDPPTLLPASAVLATFRDEAHQDDVQLRVPAYDFGRLGATQLVAGAANQGLFPLAQREKAVAADPDAPFAFVKWSTVRGARVAALEQSYVASSAPTVAGELAALPAGAPLAAYRAIGARAASAAAGCRADATLLTSARATLEEDGASDVLLGRLTAAADLLGTQAGDYAWAAERLAQLAPAQLVQDRAAIQARLERADRPGGGGLPIELSRLDASARDALDPEVEARVAYPDGPLRMLRMLEQTLRFFWHARKLWMTQRHALLTRPLLEWFFAPFVDSLAKIRTGQPSGLVLPAQARLAAIAQVGARELRLAAPLPPQPSPLGRLIHVGGDRPTAAAVIDALDGGARLAVTPLPISVAAGAALPGLPGVIEAGAPVSAAFPPISDAELRAGRSARGPAADGLIEALVRHASRLALVLGGPGAGKDRPDAAPLPAPYPSIASFEVLPPVGASATRLFLAAIPPAAQSGTGAQLPAARPGELILLRGADDDGQHWQAVVEVERCEVASGAQARADDPLTDTPTPPCCADEDPVMIVHVRAMRLPGDVTLTRAIALHRDFRGFGLRSLLSRAVLPIELDPATATVTVQDGGATRTVLRDPELEAAVAVLEDWLGTEGGALP